MKQRQLFLRDILTVLFKRKLLIVSFTVLVFAVVFVGNYVWPPTYESKATIMLMRGREVYQVDPTVMKNQEGVAMMQMSAQDVNSEIELIRSKDVVEEVCAQMKLGELLTKPPENPLKRVLYTVKQSFVQMLYVLNIKTRPTNEQLAANAVMKGLDVQPQRDSFLVDVSCRMPRPELAQAVLKTVLDTYISKRVALFTNTESSKFFEDQIVRVREDLEKSQAALKTFREENKIAALESERNLLLQEQAELAKLITQMKESEAATAQTTKSASDLSLVETLSRQTGSPVVTEMQMRLLELINERNRNSKTFGPNHPALLSLSKQIAEAQSRLGEAIQTTRATAEAKIADVEQRLTKLNEVKAALDNLEREVNVTSDSLRYYTQKLEESRVTDALAKTKMSNVRVASTPTLAVDPVRPKKLFNLIFALVAGLMASLTLAFFLEYLDHGVKTPEDVDCYLEIPALGSFFRSGRGRMDAQEADRIGTMLDVINADKPLQVIQVTSAVAGEGAQAVARAVAEAYSRELEASTLFVDFTGGATSKKQFSGRPGMSDVLMGQAVLEDVLGAENNLALLGRGTHAEFPMALWTSERFQEFMKEVRSRFTRVVFHVGPVLQAPDALRLAKNVDGVVLVIRAESTRREVVQRASDMVRDAKGKVLGAILTDRKQRIPGIVYRWI